MKTISLTVPMDYDALTRAADMFHGMAIDVKNELSKVSFDEFTDQMLGKIAASFNIPIEQLTATIDSDQPLISPEKQQQFTAETVISGDDAGKLQGDSAAPAPANGAIGVELDKDGLPWDPRINSSSKKKTVKEETWKLKRGVDPALVESVKAELKAAMSASPAAPIETAETAATTSAPAPVNTAQPPAPASVSMVNNTVAEPVKYVTANGNFTADELRAVEWTDEMIEALPIAEAEPAAAVTTTAMTFPELMAKVTQATTAGTITKEQVDQACIDNGLASLPLLAARPDLIPSVNAKLFG